MFRLLRRSLVNDSLAQHDIEVAATVKLTQAV
jgi:hypothetical protein